MTTLHIDTDIGGDIDDACALAMVLAWPNADLRGVTTNCDDHGRRAGYARYLLDLAGRNHVAVASGADISLGCYRVTPGLPTESRYWPAPIQPLYTSQEVALDLLQRSIETEVRIVAIGALTNLALLESRSPGILEMADLFIMGGSVDLPRSGFPQWDTSMDWNIQADVQSSQIVFERSTPTLIPLSVTLETALRREHLSRLRQGGPLGQVLVRQAEAFEEDEKIAKRIARTCQALPKDIINFLHDPLACAVALGWRDGLSVEEISLKFELKDGWLYQKRNNNGKQVPVVTAINGRAFSEFWLDSVMREVTGVSP